MCYSKEVTFTVGVIMVACSTYAWCTYVRGKSNEPLVSSYKNMIIGYLMIALHQFGDSFSIATGSQVLYKLGLIASISCMFFYMRAFEKLSQFSFGSRIFIILIALCAIQISSKELLFENSKFWVRGDQSAVYLFWSTSWLALFVYWNVCVIYFRSIMPSKENKKLLIYYVFFSLNLSFFLYVIYAYSSIFARGASLKGYGGYWDLFRDFDIIQDSPSIWCVFSVTQAFLIPKLFNMMNARYDPSVKPSITYLSWATRLKLLGISALIWLFCFLFFPSIFIVGVKMALG